MIVPIVILSACSSAPKSSNGQELGLPEGQSQKVTVYMIKPGDNGKLGHLLSSTCPDSIMPVEVKTESPYISRDPSASILMSLVAIKKLKADTYAAQGLANPLAKSSLQDPEIELSKDTYIIRLKGTFTVESACDAARQRAQIEETLRRAVGTHSFIIDFNGSGPQGWAKAFEVK